MEISGEPLDTPPAILFEASTISGDDVTISTSPLLSIVTEPGSNLDGALTQWQIILIVSLSATTVAIAVAFLLMWKYCHKKHPVSVHTRNVAPAPSSSPPQNDSTPSRKCCGFWMGKTPIRLLSAPSRETAQTGFHAERHSSAPEELIKFHQTRLPLPPIGDFAPQNPDRFNEFQASALSDPMGPARAHLLPRRLAPLDERGKIVATNLAGNTTVHRSSAFGPVQQNTELRSLPTIPINAA